MGIFRLNGMVLLLSCLFGRTIHTCSENWHLIHDKCYWVPPGRGSWDSALKTCYQYRGTLASVNSAQLLSDLIRFLKALNISDDRSHFKRTLVWTGGFLQKPTSHIPAFWAWTDGSEWYEPPWAPEQPSDIYHYEENCLEIMLHFNDLLNDENCTRSGYALCSRPKLNLSEEIVVISTNEVTSPLVTPDEITARGFNTSTPTVNELFPSRSKREIAFLSTSEVISPQATPEGRTRGRFYTRKPTVHELVATDASHFTSEETTTASCSPSNPDINELVAVIFLLILLMF